LITFGKITERIFRKHNKILILLLIKSQWSMVNGQWSMVNGQWSMVNGQWSMVNGQWSMVNGQWSKVNSHWAIVIGQVVRDRFENYLKIRE